MPRESNLEMKVGVFVVAAIACLVVFIFSISDFSIFKKGESYKVVFQYANGLKKDAPVRVAGVDAGRVRSIRVGFNAVTHQTEVTVDAWMESGHAIPADSKFMINQLGLLGEKYLEILPGSSLMNVKPGEMMRGDDPVPMETITRTIGSLGAKVEVTLNNINNGILTETNKKALSEALVSLAAVMQGVNTGILTEANKTALSSTLANVAQVSGSIKNGEGTMGKFLKDPGVYDNLDEMTADLKLNPWKLFYRPKK